MEIKTLTSSEGVFACFRSDVPGDGTVITRTINGSSIAIARRSSGDELIMAFESRCPHMQAPLKFGRVVEGEVVCPWHFIRFDAATGGVVSCDKTTMSLKTYPVRMEGEGVYILTTK
jgi:nitrite reductase/ring-hydroxylating ferredoxin subunit